MPLLPVTDPVQFAICFGLAFGISVTLTPLVGRWARARGIVANPRQDRWHQKPTPLLRWRCHLCRHHRCYCRVFAIRHALARPARWWRIVVCHRADRRLAAPAAAYQVDRADPGSVRARRGRCAGRHRGARRGRHPVDDPVGCRHHQRLQFARQHGRPVGRHGGHRGRLPVRIRRRRRQRGRRHSGPGRRRRRRWVSSSTTSTRRASSWAIRAACSSASR